MCCRSRRAVADAGRPSGPPSVQRPALGSYTTSWDANDVLGVLSRALLNARDFDGLRARRPKMAYWIWGGGALAGVLGLAALSAVLGAAYQVVSEKADLARHPPPGHLFDVGGGRRLHLQCSRQGEGRIVVIEAGAGNDSTLWAWLLPQIASSPAHAPMTEQAWAGAIQPLGR